MKALLGMNLLNMSFTGQTADYLPALSVRHMAQLQLRLHQILFRCAVTCALDPFPD